MLLTFFQKKSLNFTDLKNTVRPHPFLSLLDEGILNVTCIEHWDIRLSQPLLFLTCLLKSQKAVDAGEVLSYMISIFFMP